MGTIHAIVSDEASAGWAALSKAWGPSKTAILESIGIEIYDAVIIQHIDLRNSDDSWFPSLTTFMTNALDITSDRRSRKRLEK